MLYTAFSCVFACEAVRVAGMGGAFAGLYSTEGAIFGNPAGLINVQANNLSVALSAQDLRYESLPAVEGEQLNTKLSFRLNPSIYYSRAIGSRVAECEELGRIVGVGLGYVDDLNNRSSVFKIEDTEAEYIVDERKFISNTDTVLEYDFFRERGPVFSLGCLLSPRLAIGIRLKYRHQIVKEGVIYRPVSLTAVHGEEVNRNDATKLLPAIIDNLEIDEAIERFKEGKDSHEDVMVDLSESGFDLDLGMQVGLPAPGNVSAGFMLDVLDTPRVRRGHWTLDSGDSASGIRHEPSRIRLGIGAMPKEWLIAALDLEKALGDSGLGVNLGWEIRYRWQRWFSGGIMIRNGFARETVFRQDKSEGSASKINKLSIGIGLSLGDSQWDYTLVRPVDSSQSHKSAHILSSTTRF